MRISSWVGIAAVVSLSLSAAIASPEKVALERKSYLQATELWTLKVRAAHTPEERRAIWDAKPSANAHAERLWALIKGSLSAEWTLEPAAWVVGSAPQMREPVEAIRAAMEKHHLGSPKITSLVYALTAVPDPRTLAMLEKLSASSPHASVRGTAALGTALLLKSLGDEGDIMKRRLTLLRQAIIDSSTVNLGGRSVSQIAQDELFVIANLTKGRVAPEISGTDVAGKPMKLSDARGKVVVLLFWGTWNNEAEKTLELTNSLVARMAGKKFEVIGVNADEAAILREMHAAKSVTWRNFSDTSGEIAATYRVRDWPIAYVLDAEGKIQFIGAPGTFVDLAAEALLNG
jgi:peroxiredoxin